jgi:hypothetical protein
MKPISNHKTVIHETFNPSGTPDVAKISALLHESGLTPYIFVRRGLKYLVNGHFSEARRYIDFAMEFRGIFFEAGSPEDREYCVEMQLLNAAFIFLTEKFNSLPADIERMEIKRRG